MMTTLAKVTGLALLAASFAFCSSLAYAGTEIRLPARFLPSMPSAIPAKSSRRSTATPATAWAAAPSKRPVAADTATTVADAFDPAVLEATPEATAENNEPVIRSVDTIPAKVNETTVISAIGNSDTAIEDAAQSLAITLSAAEPASENKTTSDAFVFPAQ